ncbi:MAG: hypothetical protein IKC81_07820 [Paludibacteraceae bacterium]|nr:hypothetical protein [Paludibacteraceae bacterium]
MNAKLKIMALSLMCAFSMGAMAQAEKQKEVKDYASKVGDMAIGVNFNPVAAAQGSSPLSFSTVGQFLYGTDTVDGIIGSAESKPHQMFILAQQPMVSISYKYQLKEHMAFTASDGFSGGYITYREYVDDDKALALNPMAEDQVADAINLNYTGGGITAGLEFSAGKNLRFVGGFGLIYSFGGGDVSFNYGNQITALNQHPTTMEKIDKNINEFASSGCTWMDYGRPLYQKNVGISQGIGIYANLGIEWFFMKNVSLGATVDLTPIMVAFQPQTYTVYEGYDKYNNKVAQYNDLVSPGSSYLLYGTDNIGVNISFHYYF